MHELTLAKQIADTVLAHAAERSAKRVLAVEVELGDLAFLDKENMEMWIGASLRDSSGSEPAVRVTTLQSLLRCHACGFEGPPVLPESHDHHLPLPSLQCPRCGSSDFELDEQKGCLLKRIEIEV
ncbi:MAG: hydrogenase maturation nickel metallochaperone HypA [Dehalococcoidia bacterium]|nr:hydrogenase maturation nickel metallochaperone HypA [Dehalococcoidia bacterium]